MSNLIFRYYYGYQVSELLDLSNLVETYQAADKYIANDLNEKLLEHMKTIFDVSNCCIIYDQLLKMQTVDVLQLNDVRRMIQLNTEEAFMSRSFIEIDLHTLVDILSLDDLNIDEIDILKACSRWTEMECSRNGMQPNSANMQEIFRTIKHRICFTNLSIEQIKDFDQIERLLGDEEIGSFFIHLLNKSKKLAIECKPQRQRCQDFTVVDDGESYFSYHGLRQQMSEISFKLNVNHRVLIRLLCTHLPANLQNLSLLIDGEKAKWVSYSEKLGWIFGFKNYLQVAPNQPLQLTFKFDNFTFNEPRFKLSKKTELIANNIKQTVFKLTIDKYHCIECIHFYE